MATHPYIQEARLLENLLATNRARINNRNYHGHLLPDDVVARWSYEAKELRYLAKSDIEEESWPTEEDSDFDES